MADEPTEQLIEERLSAARGAAEVADREVARAAAAESDRMEALDAAKARCRDTCGAVSAKLAETTDPRERQALVELEAELHAQHAAELEAAYLAFAGQRASEANPASPGVTTPVSSEVSVAAATQA